MEKQVIDIKAEDNEYLHKDFHITGDNGLEYVGMKYGDNGVREYLTRFAKAFYKPLFDAYRKKGLKALMEQQQKLYEAEKMPEVFHAELDDDCLTVTVDRCPGVTFMKERGKTPSRWYKELTNTVNMAIADELDLGFSLEYYNEEDGSCKYRYFRRAF